MLGNHHLCWVKAVQSKQRPPRSLITTLKEGLFGAAPSTLRSGLYKGTVFIHSKNYWCTDTHTSPLPPSHILSPVLDILSLGRFGLRVPKIELGNYRVGSSSLGSSSFGFRFRFRLEQPRRCGTDYSPLPPHQTVPPLPSPLHSSPLTSPCSPPRPVTPGPLATSQFLLPTPSPVP